MSINNITDNLTLGAHHRAVLNDYHKANTQGAANKSVFRCCSLYLAVVLGMLSNMGVQAETQADITQVLKDDMGLSLERSQFSVSFEPTGATKDPIPGNESGVALSNEVQYSKLASELKQLHQGASLSRLWRQDKSVSVDSVNEGDGADGRVDSANSLQVNDNLAAKTLAQSDAAAKSKSINLKVVNTQDQGLVSMTREQKMAAKSAENSVSKQSLQSSGVFHSFNIYDANTHLLEDFDGDSFYSTFSVTFDADVDGIAYNEYADVYAELYVSQEGGPWLHYYTTEVFSIAGNSSYDDYRVLTTLQSGYQTAHYDVLIDLYEVGVNDPVATLSSNDTNALYALPLESRDRDPIYVAPHVDTYIEVEAGGALSWWELLVLVSLGLLAIRKSPQG